MVKKRLLALASVALLLAMLVVAMVGVQRMVATSKCRPEIELILPDGHILELSSGPGYVMGNAATVVGLQGFSLPGVEHQTQTLYQTPGVLLRSVDVQPRIVDVVLSLWSRDGTRYGLHRTRAQLLDAFRWDRGATDTALTTLRYTLNGVSRELYLTFDGVVESQLGRHGLNETWAVRFLVPDPMWYDPDTEEQVLDWADSSTVRYFASRVDGVWEQDITQPAAVGAGILLTGVWAIAVDPGTGNVYVAGDFTNWDNIANADFLVRWNVGTAAWEAVGDNGAGGPAINNPIHCLTFGPDRALYLGGRFTNAGGVPTADYIAQVNPDTLVWNDVGGGPGAGAVTWVQDIVIGYDGIIYVGGNFTNWNGIAAADYLTQWDGVAWAAVGGVFDNTVEGLVIMPNGHLVAGGTFTTIGGVGYVRIAEWDPVAAAWSALGTGMNLDVYHMNISPDGILYAVGAFTTAGGNTVNYVAQWNGAAWSDLDAGLDAPARRVEIASDGTVYVCGIFTQAGPLTITDSLARWNGYSWTHIDIDIPGIPGFFVGLALSETDDLYIGWDTTGVAYYAGDNSVVNEGSAFALPIIEVKNHGLLQSIRNETMGYDIPCDMLIQDGEIVTIDLSTGKKSADSTWRPLGRLNDILPNSDLGTFKLESASRAQYGSVAGANLITAFITGADPREHNDGGLQLSGWDGITGISQDNTNLGILYASIVVVGGGFNRLDLYMDAARTLLVGQTANYNAPGAQAIVPQNASGLGGTITIDAVGAGDVDIFAYYTIVTMTWTPRWWSLDEAVVA